MKKTVSMTRALMAVVLGCSYTAITMYNLSKALLLKQASAYEHDISVLKSLINKNQDQE